jgi:hypothetical protein
MTKFGSREALAQVATITDAPHVRADIDRSFELPTGLYVATVALYLAFIGLMAVAFMNPQLVLPMVIFAVFIVAAFGTPALWARMRPETRQRALSYGLFRNRGIYTATGHLPAGAATVQVLVLPVLIFLWGIAVAIIAAVN